MTLARDTFIHGFRVFLGIVTKFDAQERKFRTLVNAHSQQVGDALDAANFNKNAKPGNEVHKGISESAFTNLKSSPKLKIQIRKYYLKKNSIKFASNASQNIANCLYLSRSRLGFHVKLVSGS